MASMRWNPGTTLTRQEEFLMKRLTRTRKLFGFLRTHRSELLDDAFQDELESMYRDTGAGKDAVPPALLAMVVLLQGYQGISDAEAVEMTVVDLRWQLVLGAEPQRDRRAARGSRLHRQHPRARRARSSPRSPLQAVGRAQR
jgi:Transposase domain (DUF772)